MARFFGRKWALTLGTSSTTALRTEGLYLDFQIEKSLAQEPNKAAITVYNLSAEHRKAVEDLSTYDPLVKAKTRPNANAHKVPKTGKIRVELEAGYEDFSGVIFRGDLRWARSTFSGGTWATEIEGEDGGRTYLASRISQAFPAGTTAYNVVTACADAMGLGRGNLANVADKLAWAYSHGTVASGWAAEELAGVIRRSGLRYSIQNGALFFENIALRTELPALVIAPDSGLVGYPAKDANGLVTFTSLLHPDLAPGAYVALQSSHISGNLKIYRVTYSGSVDKSEWYAKCECLPG